MHRFARARVRALLKRLFPLICLAAAAGATAAFGGTDSLLYPVYIGISLALGVLASTTLIWMLNAWRTPASLADVRLEADDIEPAHTFSLLVPARHEETVLEATLSTLVKSDHPAFEVLVIVGSDDAGTREAAERVAERHPEIVRVVIDPSWPKSKPRAMNAALPYCRGTITGVFDAEDEVHPRLLRRIDQRFQRTGADVIQAGVQLMNFRSSWLTVRNVLEYYFWFRSRLHLHARQGFIPLGGNTVFIRTEVLRAVSGWDADCLAEDCELGIRLSSLGARTVVVYEPELVTREECPPTLSVFTRQRTRWNQGYLQTLSKGYWRRLPRRQRALGVYMLSMPYVMAIAWVLMPIAAVTAFLVSAPVLVTLCSFLPALPILSTLAVEVVGLSEFCRLYGERASARDYARLVVGLPVYQGVLAYAAARAVLREARGERGWEKTAHLGLHLDPAVAAASNAAPQAVALSLAQRAVGSGGSVVLQAEAPPVVHGREDHHVDHLPVAAMQGEPLWTRLDLLSVDGSASVSLPNLSARGAGHALGTRFRTARHRIRRLATHHVDLAVQLVVLVGVGLVLATNMLHWPATHFDEGTYVGNAWAVGERGVLSFYTYTYGHPPLGWPPITVWVAVKGLFGHATYSLDGGREAMFAVSIISCSLLYTLARRMQISRIFAAATVVLFALSPLALFYHRTVLIDNPATAWALAAFVLALTPSRRLSAFAASGACFAVSVLSKETTLVLLPALFLAAAQNCDRSTRRYCLTLFGSFLVLTAVFYPLYATLKGELLPGPGHVSLFEAINEQLFTREKSGSVFDPHSGAHQTLAFWLDLDPWLVGAAVLFSPVALALRRTRPVALALLIQVAMILRPGYLPNMYVIGLLPFAALVVTGTLDALWRVASNRHPRRQAPAGGGRWRMVGFRAAVVLRRVGIVAAAGALAVAVAIAGLAVAPRWTRADHEAMTLRLDAPLRDAQHWILHNIGRDERLIVTDDFWVYLIENGFNSRRADGGLNSRTVVSFWPLDKDPAVHRLFPHGWRDFDYVISTPGLRAAARDTPKTAAAVRNSRIVATFGPQGGQIEIRRIVGGIRRQPHG